MYYRIIFCFLSTFFSSYSSFSYSFFLPSFYHSLLIYLPLSSVFHIIFPLNIFPYSFIFSFSSQTFPHIHFISPFLLSFCISSLSYFPSSFLFPIFLRFKYLLTFLRFFSLLFLLLVHSPSLLPPALLSFPFVLSHPFPPRGSTFYLLLSYFSFSSLCLIIFPHLSPASIYLTLPSRRAFLLTYLYTSFTLALPHPFLSSPPLLRIPTSPSPPSLYIFFYPNP